MLESLNQLIKPSPTLLMIRNVVVLLIIGFVAYRVIFGRRGDWLRGRIPILQKAGTKLNAKKLVKGGEFAQAGELLLQQGAQQKAIETFIEGQLYGRAADVYLSRRQIDKAANLYEKAGQHEKAAQLYIERKNYEKAEENLTKVGKQDEIARLYEEMGAKSLAANAYLRTGRVSEGIRLLVDEGEYHTAAKKLKSMYEDPEVMFSSDLGFADRRELAQEAANLFLKAKVPLEAAELFASEQFFKEAGKAYQDAKQFEKAIECFSKGDFFFEAAEVYYQLGQHQRAASLEAEGFIREGNEEKAARSYIKAGDYANAGDVYRNLGEFKKAGEMYEKAREFALAGSMYSEAEQFERAGYCFEKVKKYEEAIDYYGKAENYARQVGLLEKVGRFAEAAENYRKRGLVDEAMQMLEKVERDHADYKKACGIHGKILMDQGKLSAAKEKLEEAVSNIEHIGSDDVGTIYDLARVTENLGGNSAALFTIEKMLAEDFVKGQNDGPMDEVKKKLSTVVTKITHRSSAMKSPQFASAVSMQAQAAMGTSAGAVVESQPTRYVPIKEIGKGGMGIVYRARDTVLDRIVALKVLPSNLRKNKQAVATFTREARNAAALNHKNIVTVHDAGIQEGDYFIAMELIDGMTIKEIIKKNKRLNMRSVYAVVKQLLEGLAYAHEKNIVHRDLTNNNIMWNRNKLVKIMDFGLAKVVRELQSEQSIIGGTPSYMSPEQTLGNPIDHRTDIYSLGVCLYEMCLGELPFRKGNLGYHHVHTKPPDPAEKHPSLPQPVTAVIRKCMEKKPDKRPQSVQEVVDQMLKVKEFAAV